MPTPFQSSSAANADGDYPFAVLIEVEAYDENDYPEDRLFEFLELVGDSIEDGVVAQDEKQYN